MFSMITMVAMVLISFLIQPKTQNQTQKPAAMNENDFPRCEEGTSKAIAFGQVKTKDYMVLWSGGYSTKAIKQKGGKK